MNRYFCGFLLYLSLFSISAQAQENFSSQILDFEISRIAQSLKDLGWQEFSGPGQIPTGSFNFDQAFIRENSEEYILVKIIPSKNKNQKLVSIPMNGGIIFNFQSTWDNLISMYVDSKNPALHSEILKALGQKKVSRWELLIPKAHARDRLDCNPRAKPTEAMRQVGGSAMVSSCFFAALGGIGNEISGTLSTVGNVASGAWDILTNPSSAKQYWEKGKAQFEAIKTAISEIDKAVPAFYEAIKNLSPQAQTELLCAWVGSLVPSALASLLGGAGLPKFLLKISTSITKLKALNSTMATFSRMRGLLPGKAQGEVLAAMVTCGI